MTGGQADPWERIVRAARIMSAPSKATPRPSAFGKAACATKPAPANGSAGAFGASVTAGPSSETYAGVGSGAAIAEDVELTDVGPEGPLIPRVMAKATNALPATRNTRPEIILLPSEEGSRHRHCHGGDRKDLAIVARPADRPPAMSEVLCQFLGGARGHKPGPAS